MKYVISVLVLFGVIVSLFLVHTVGSPVLAEGDKVRGDEAVGPAYQLGETPFKG
jgi:hypothetical protein